MEIQTYIWIGHLHIPLEKLLEKRVELRIPMIIKLCCQTAPRELKSSGVHLARFLLQPCSCPSVLTGHLGAPGESPLRLRLCSSVLPGHAGQRGHACRCGLTSCAGAGALCKAAAGRSSSSCHRQNICLL